MVCQHYGRSYSLECISVLCPPTKEGVSLLGLNDAAIALGFHTISARAEIAELNNLPLPCILHWNQNHFVVLYKVKKNKKFYIADPGKELVKYNFEEFKKHWISTKSDGEEKGTQELLSAIKLCGNRYSENRIKSIGILAGIKFYTYLCPRIK